MTTFVTSFVIVLHIAACAGESLPGCGFRSNHTADGSSSAKYELFDEKWSKKLLTWRITEYSRQRELITKRLDIDNLFWFAFRVSLPPTR